MATVAATEKKKRIGELLIDAGIIDTEQLKEALDYQKEHGGKVVEVLLDLGHLDVDSIAQFLAAQPGIPSIDLSNYQISEELCMLVPREFAVSNEIFPIDKMGKLLTVGMVFPLDTATIDSLCEITGLRVKALLCSADDIKGAINHFYPGKQPSDEVPTEVEKEKRGQTSAKLQGIAELVQQIDGLPVLPDTVRRVQEAAKDPEVALKDISAIVERDPAISAKLLQLANSPAYGFRSQIDNVTAAITLLGLKETQMVVLSSAIIDLTEKSNTFDHEQFWADSIFCATAARQTLSLLGLKNKSGVFTAALLYDIGRYALSEAANDKYAKINKRLIGETLVKAEEQVLGIAHPEAGYLLACGWSLPEEICDGIRFHHTPQHAKDNESALAINIVALASFMTDTHRRDIAPAPEVFEDQAALLQAIGLDAAAAAEIFGKTIEAQD